MFVCAHKGIDALSLSEALWLNQKKWSSMEKTFILFHIDKARNKRKKQLPLTDIAMISALTSVAIAAQCKDHKTLTAVMALLAVTKTLTMAVDLTKDHALNKLAQKELNELSQTNENVRMGIRCLTPRTSYAN